MRRSRRHVRVPPDLTSLFDVLFIVIFACLIRAAAAQHAAEAAEVKLAEPRPVVRDEFVTVHVAARGAITAIDTRGRTIAVDAPLLERSADPDVVETYLGDRSSELRACRVAALHLGVADLARYVVVIAVDRPLGELPHALYDGLHRDVVRCAAEQKGMAVIVAP
ncbi:MAG TPA: hypothetical protein VMJ10_16990 [Kofleriaceae bacterium]|nr:hypothetical protein [Kofleriaceae bacterium]